MSHVTARERPPTEAQRLDAAMVVLGIETSCDETAAALVEETGDLERPWRLRSSVVASQVEIHRVWGGVVPELSARHERDEQIERRAADGHRARAYSARKKWPTEWKAPRSS